MSNGLFQHLPGSHEMAGSMALPNEPWLLPIDDRAGEPSGRTSEELQSAVRAASRPFWIAANGLCAALGLALLMQAATGFTASPPRASVSVAQATPPTLAPQQASLAR